MTEQTYAEQLKAARAALGLSQAKLAEWSTVPRRTIEDWETGRRVPPDYVQRLVLEKISTYNDKPKDETMRHYDVYCKMVGADRATLEMLWKQAIAFYENATFHWAFVQWLSDDDTDTENPYEKSIEDAKEAVKDIESAIFASEYEDLIEVVEAYNDDAASEQPRRTICNRARRAAEEVKNRKI